MRVMLLALSFAATLSAPDACACADRTAAVTGRGAANATTQFHVFASLAARSVRGSDQPRRVRARERVPTALGYVPEGVGGVLVDEVVVRGVLQGRGGWVAMLGAPTGRTYTVRAGDRLMDGSVRSIDATSVMSDERSQRSHVAREAARSAEVLARRGQVMGSHARSSRPFGTGVRFGRSMLMAVIIGGAVVASVTASGGGAVAPAASGAHGDRVQDQRAHEYRDDRVQRASRLRHEPTGPAHGPDRLTECQRGCAGAAGGSGSTRRRRRSRRGHGT